MQHSTHVAVDLGASSARVMLGRVGDRTLDLRELHRAPNRPVRLPSGLHWDVLALYAAVLDGLRAAGRESGQAGQSGQPDSMGIDSWAVDYGLLDADGALLGNPHHHRDSRTDGVLDQAFAKVPAQEIYRITGLQFLPFNTAYQLLSALGSAQLDAAERLLLVPDLLAYWLTGVQATEATNAATTQLYDVDSGSWSKELIDAFGLPARIFGPIVQPGERIGDLTAAVLEETGLREPLPLLAVGSHDTASAVLAVPAADDAFAYVSCGSWSLVGLELDAPVLTDESREANFTNERGVDGSIRYLRNVSGLWLLQECIRVWSRAGHDADVERLVADAAREPAFACLVDADDPVFVAPGDMPERIAQACRDTGQPAPASPAATVRCILDSLALAYRRTLRDAQRLSGKHVDVVHVVGGGSQNALLCQLTADACGLPVEAGPVEATALGNVLAQARAFGTVDPDRHGVRRLVRNTQDLHRYEPRGDSAGWDAAEARVRPGR